MNEDSIIEIKVALLRSKTSQVKIARRLGISVQYVNTVIKGQRTTMRVRKAIARAVGKRVGELWPSGPHREAA